MSARTSGRRTPEPAAARVSRLLALVPWLIAHDGVTVEEAAAQFGVSVDQLEADLTTATFCGPGQYGGELIDIDYVDGQIAVIDPQVLDRPLRLTADEATSLVIGLRMLAALPGAGGDTDPTTPVLSAMSRLEQAIETTVPASVAVEAPDPEVNAVVAQALADQAAVRIRYAAATGDELTERVVWPQRSLSVDGRVSVVAFDARSAATRTFRLDRIVSAEPAGDVAPPAPAETATEPAQPLEVELRIRPAARWVAESPGVRQVSEEADGTLRARLDVLDLRWLTRLVLGEGGDVVVVAPAQAVAAVRHAATAALRAYGEPSRA